MSNRTLSNGVRMSTASYCFDGEISAKSTAINGVHIDPRRPWSRGDAARNFVSPYLRHEPRSLEQAKADIRAKEKQLAQANRRFGAAGMVADFLLVASLFIGTVVTAAVSHMEAPDRQVKVYQERLTP